MDWNTLYATQKELDSYIEKKHRLTNNDMFNKKHLALLVELGELANETRSFKFWSTKGKKATSVILEEYVDNLHFILSLGLEKGYYFNQKGNLSKSNLSETDQFNDVFEACILFKKETTKENYEKLFLSFLQLGQLLGFNKTAIQTAYFKKNEINFKRQDKGY